MTYEVGGRQTAPIQPLRRWGALQLNWAQRQIIAAIARNGPTNRLSIAAELSLSPQTASRAIKAMIADDLLGEAPVHNGMRGQPARELAYRSGSLATLGVSLSDTRIAVRLEDIDGSVLTDEEVFGHFEHPQSAIAEALLMVQQAYEMAPSHSQIVGMGVAAKGFFVRRGRSVVSRQQSSAWARLDIRKVFENALGVEVSVCNNARAVAMGNMRALGPGAVRNALFVYIGNGIGGALVLDGKLAEGAHGNAGEIGALIPDGPGRPSRTRLAELLKLKDWSRWKGMSSLSSDSYSRLRTWCAEASALLEPALQAATYLVDVDTIYVCARFPLEVAQTIVADISLVPHGTMLLPYSEREKLLQPPRIEVLGSVAMESGACALALSRYFDGGAGQITQK